MFKRFLSKDKKIISILLFGALFIVSFVIILFGFIWINDEYSEFNSEIKKVKENYLSEQKTLIKNETEKVVYYINTVEKTTKTNLIKELTIRVNAAYAISSNIYYGNINSKSKSEIIKLVKDALQGIIFFKNTGNFSILNKKGDIILSNENPEKENKNCISLKDDVGNFVIKNKIKLANKNQEGFISEYWKINVKDNEKVYEKVCYVKYFKALDIIISAEEFIFFYEKNIKRNMLDDISKIRFGKNGYIFVNNYDGKALISDGKIIDENINLWNLEDPNGIKVIQEERKAVQNPNGDFIYYSWRKLQDTIPLPKMSFIKGVEEWQWMVGAGVYIDEANKIINQKREILKQQIKKQILIIVSVLLLTFLLILLVYLNITKKAKRNIQNFLSFFKKASNENLYINENKINFQEFKILASSANKMVSNIRKTTAEKEEEEAYFERLFEIAPEAITILDLNGKIKRVNNKFVDLFGFSQNELIGKDVDKMIVPEELFGEARINAEMVLNKDTFISEGIRICKNGKNINVSIIATSIELKQGEIGIYVIYRDITDQKEFENKLNEAKDKAEESDRLKASFLANISHEIRTPMNSILGFSSLLELPDIDQDSKSTYIKHINISGNELLKIIENILALSRLEAKELTINITKCNLSELFNELQFIFIEKKNKDTDFILKKNNSENSVIYTDCRRLKQIMSSFIDNALKFTKEGYIEFGYKILGEKIKFYVKDTGIGLSEDKKKIIFDRFRQVEETHTRKYGGTGLGLSIAKKLVELLNGEIKIESELGKGAEFSFCLPYKQVKKETPNNIENFSPKKFIWKDKKILIAEDEEINFLFIKNILKPTQATLWRAKNGEDVMKIINTDNKPDIILMDIKMPIMTGNEALKEIRKKDINIPVIAQTAYTLDNEQSELLEMGYNDFILKPYSINNLIKIIAKYLS